MKPIATEEDYRLALIKFEAIFDAPTDTPESNEADGMVKLVDKYEKESYPI